MEAILHSTLDILLPLVGTVVTVILIPALIRWMQTQGAIKDAEQAKILQSAFANAAQAALAKAGGSPADLSKAAIDYVRMSVPETAAKLSDDQIAALVLPHVQRIAPKNAGAAP